MTMEGGDDNDPLKKEALINLEDVRQSIVAKALGHFADLLQSTMDREFPQEAWVDQGPLLVRSDLAPYVITAIREDFGFSTDIENAFKQFSASFSPRDAILAILIETHKREDSPDRLYQENNPITFRFGFLQRLGAVYFKEDPGGTFSRIDDGFGELLRGISLLYKANPAYGLK